MERPLLLPLLALIFGLCTAWFFSFPVTIPVFVPFLLIAAALLTLLPRSPVPFVAVLLMLLYLWGFLSVHTLLQDGVAPPAADGQPVMVEGVVAGRPDVREQGSRLIVQVVRLFRNGRLENRAGGRLLVSVENGMPDCITGDLVRFEARPVVPRPYGLPGETDYRRALLLRRIEATAYVADARSIVLLEAAAVPSVQRRIDLLARRLGRGIDAALPAPEAGILRALLLGDAGAVPREIKDAYSRTGVNHILSISGFHVGIVALVLFTLLFSICRMSPFLLLHGWLRRSLGVLVLPVVVMYLLLSGSAPATIRSVIMLGACAIALVLERESDPVNALLLAALAILGMEPQALFDLSFQLSFLALWGIIVLTPLFLRMVPRPSHRLLRLMLNFLLASLSATLATLVPVAFYFHQASATGLLSNFLIVPLMGYGAVVAGFIALPLLLVSPVPAAPFLYFAGGMIRLSNWFIGYLDRVPLLPRYLPGRLQFGLFLLVMTALTFIRSPRWRYGAAGTLLAAMGLLVLLPGERPAESFSLYFFSVGQGESSLLTFPDGRTMLIDAGGSYRDAGFDTGARLVAPALRHLGVRRLDYVVLSHPHPDHLGGLPFIAREFEIGEFWEAGTPVQENDERYQVLKALLHSRGVTCRQLTDETPPVTIGGVRVAVLNPVAGAGSAADANDTSLILKFTEGPLSLLMPGDAGQPVQRRLMTLPGALDCTVLKVPHHGSKLTNLPAFFRTAAPQAALISAGYGNRYRFPAPEIVTQLQQVGTRIYRTDLQGTVVIQHRPGERGYRISTPYGHFN